MQRREDGTQHPGAAEFWHKVGNARLDKPSPPPNKEAPPQPDQAIESAAAASTAGTIDAAQLGPIPEQLNWGESLIDFFSRFGGVLPAIAGIAIILILAAGAWYSHKQRDYDTAALVKSRAQPAAVVPLPEQIAPKVEETVTETEPPADVPTIFPCPSGLPFCIGGAGKLKDANCPRDKPIWAHYLDNDGLWKRAGCYAAEADAKAGLSVLLGSNTPSLDTQVAPENKSVAENAKRTNVAPKQKHAPRVAETENSKSIDSKTGSLAEFTVSFELAFGIVVESRTYPTLQMKRKAVDLWNRERKILEPDGTINEKYVLRPHAPGPVPGH